MAIHCSSVYCHAVGRYICTCVCTYFCFCLLYYNHEINNNKLSRDVSENKSNLSYELRALLWARQYCMEVLIWLCLLCVVSVCIVFLVKYTSSCQRLGMASSLATGHPSHSSGMGRNGGLWTATGRVECSHPLYKKLSGMSGKVNAMAPGEVKQRLTELRMDHKLVLVYVTYSN